MSPDYFPASDGYGQFWFSNCWINVDLFKRLRFLLVYILSANFLSGGTYEIPFFNDFKLSYTKCDSRRNRWIGMFWLTLWALYGSLSFWNFLIIFCSLTWFKTSRLFLKSLHCYAVVGLASWDLCLKMALFLCSSIHLLVSAFWLSTNF